MFGKSAIASFFVAALAVVGTAAHSKKKKEPRTALIVVDTQNCFLPTGTLPVADSLAILPIIKRIINVCKFDLIVATQDWHTKNHTSFYTEHPPHKEFDVIEISYRGVTMNQTLWPPHCIIGSKDAHFAPGLPTDKYDYVVRKGDNWAIDSYSGFADNGATHYTAMDSILSRHNIKRTVQVGLATDYCVQYTSVDSSKFNYESHVISDAVRAVGGIIGTSQAFSTMEQWGVGIQKINSKWFKELCPAFGHLN